jgi:hypothetical protein
MTLVPRPLGTRGVPDTQRLSAHWPTDTADPEVTTRDLPALAFLAFAPTPTWLFRSPKLQSKVMCRLGWSFFPLAGLRFPLAN